MFSLCQEGSKVGHGSEVGGRRARQLLRSRWATAKGVLLIVLVASSASVAVPVVADIYLAHSPTSQRDTRGTNCSGGWRWRWCCREFDCLFCNNLETFAEYVLLLLWHVRSAKQWVECKCRQEWVPKVSVSCIKGHKCQRNASNRWKSKCKYKILTIYLSLHFLGCPCGFAVRVFYLFRKYFILI